MIELTEFMIQIVYAIFSGITLIINIINEVLPIIDIFSGMAILILSIGTIYLIMKLFEKEILFKTTFIIILSASFFALIRSIDVGNEMTVYLTSLEVGLAFLIIMACFSSWDEESENYIN